VPELVRRTAAALGKSNLSYELILVDDGSTDDTQAVVDELARKFPLRLIQRGRAAEGGLSGAVLAGFAAARGHVLAVMDADLQHPPERLPELLSAVDVGNGVSQGSCAEMVVGSRYVEGGSVAERWGVFRKFNSLVATWLARPFAGNVRDPMSGFFALPRTVYERGRHLSPLGYKILLELMCKCTPRPVVEVPIHFGERYAGRSKLTIKEQFRYLEHLSRLYDYKFPRASPIVKFAIVVTLAWLAGAAVFAAGVGRVGAVAAMAFAYAAAIAVAAVFHVRYVRTQRKFLVRPKPWNDFFGSALAEWLTAVAVAGYLTARSTRIPVWELFLIAFGAATVVRYILRKELLLDIRGLRPEERLAGMLDKPAMADAAQNAEATERASRARDAAPGDESNRGAVQHGSDGPQSEPR
jgi:dolichol-phosphate mannosyltransferase